MQKFFVANHFLLRENPMYLYATNKLEKPSLRIPKILHFVWVSRTIPAKYVAAIDKFKKDNEDYEVDRIVTVNNSLPNISPPPTHTHTHKRTPKCKSLFFLGQHLSRSNQLICLSRCRLSNKFMCSF